jgi:hypothetical protein
MVSRELPKRLFPNGCLAASKLSNVYLSLPGVSKKYHVAKTAPRRQRNHTAG